MGTYLLRDIDPTLWERVKARAVTEGRSLRGLILWLLAKSRRWEGALMALMLGALYRALRGRACGRGRRAEGGRGSGGL